jgi:hypothetical protein
MKPVFFYSVHDFPFATFSIINIDWSLLKGLPPTRVYSIIIAIDTIKDNDHPAKESGDENHSKAIENPTKVPDGQMNGLEKTSVIEWRYWTDKLVQEKIWVFSSCWGWE